MSGPLQGLRVFDLTRILAGPTATQLLGDLGADVIKIERTGEGDDTRRWGPPFLKKADGSASDTAAYYLAANRAKRSVTIDIAKPEGQTLAHKLLTECDILVENFKTGGLAKYGLDYASVRETKPDIIYCSITGFGQTGPYAKRAGYDYLAQGMGGIMSLTGRPDGQPTKVGVGIADVMCGMYAVSAILAAVHHRHNSGQGQHIDLALLDTQIAWLVNEGLNYLTSGKVPQRIGNEHPNIVPYNVLPTSDGHFILAVGNDSQFRKFCGHAGAPELADDPRFATNALRCENRRVLYDEILPPLTRQRTQQEWIDGLAEIGVPAGAVNTLDQVFEDPQVQHRGMKIQVPYEDSEKGQIDMIGNPIKFSETPIAYNRPPPKMGEHSDEVYRDLLGLSDTELSELREKGVI